MCDKCTKRTGEGENTRSFYVLFINAITKHKCRYLLFCVYISERRLLNTKCSQHIFLGIITEIHKHTYIFLCCAKVLAAEKARTHGVERISKTEFSFICRAVAFSRLPVLHWLSLTLNLLHTIIMERYKYGLLLFWPK